MAATLARCIGRDKGRNKDVHRLGSVSSTGYAQTYRTFSECHVNRDGSGYIQVTRRGPSTEYKNGDAKILHRVDFGPENERESG